jgi:hypothetical protein
MFGPSRKRLPEASERLSDLVRRVRQDQERLRKRVDSKDGEGWYEQPATDFGPGTSFSDLLSRDRI